MYSYALASLRIDSFIEFPELFIDSNNATDQITFLKAESEFPLANHQAYYQWYQNSVSINLSFFKVNSKIILEYPNLCQFIIEDNKVNFYAYLEISDQQIRHLFLDQIIPLYLSRQYFILHASAVEFEKQAYLFLGSSGVGKSTIASKLLSLAKLISDDYCLLSQESAHFNVKPSYPAIRTIAISDKAKQQNIIPKEKFTNSSDIKVNSVIILKRNFDILPGEIQIDSISENNLDNLLSETIQIDPEDSQTQLKILNQTSDLINSVRLKQLEFSDLRDINDKDLINLVLL